MQAATRAWMPLGQVLLRRRALAPFYRGAPRPPADALVDRNVMVGMIRDHEIAERAARALRVRVLPPAWQ